MMKVVHTVASLTAQIQAWQQQSLSVGFVPTMGALHDGHMQLVQTAKKENDRVVVSVFVNPVQFNNAKDLETYPRTLEADVARLEAADCALVFAPSAEEMYPQGEQAATYHLGGLDAVMEGAYRPGHFQGVALVVDKLLRMVQPHKAYFGKKDYQQLAIIQYMVAHSDVNVQIVPVPIVRETDGLAMSSRNRRLSAHHRAVAPAIYEQLLWIQAHSHHMTVAALEQKAIARLTTQGFVPDYVSIVDRSSLQPLAPAQLPTHAVVCVAAYLGEVRLIDNMEI